MQQKIAELQPKAKFTKDSWIAVQGKIHYDVTKDCWIQPKAKFIVMQQKSAVLQP